MSTEESAKGLYDSARNRLEGFCAYQDRSQWEAEEKMKGLGLTADQEEELMIHLISNKYLNEERFARSYARGKFRQNKWGRYKISQGLKAKRVSSECIAVGLSEIDEEEYRTSLQMILEKKNATIKDKNPFGRKRKLANHAMQKGYESGLIWELIECMM